MATTLGTQAYTLKEVNGILAIVSGATDRVIFEVTVMGVELDLKSTGAASGRADLFLHEPGKRGK